MLAGLALAGPAASQPLGQPIAKALIQQRAGHIPSVPARAVRNGWGVCALLGVGPLEATASMLQQLRTRSLRITMFQFGQSAAPQLRSLQLQMRAQGISDPDPKVMALINAYMHDHVTTWPMQRAGLLEFAQTGMLRAIEGPNEINGRLIGGIGTHGPDDRNDRTGPDDFAANHLAWCQALARFKRENIQSLRNVSTVAPSLVTSPPSTFQKLSDVSRLVDAGNLHFYAGNGLQPTLSFRFNSNVGTFFNNLHWVQVTEMAGGGPVWLTECGATTSNVYARDGKSQAKYFANQLFDYFSAEGQQMFIYSLIDTNGTPGDNEGNLGLFRHDGSQKPVVGSLAGLQELLSLGSYDDPRNATDTGPIPHVFDAQMLVVPGLTGMSVDDPNCLVMPKADGSVLVAVWNEPTIDDGKGHEVTPAARSVSVDFGSEQRFAVHDLMDPELLTGLRARRSRAQSGRGTDLALRGYPMIVELFSPGHVKTGESRRP